ncbi:MAG: response regulator [Verrucomicrobiae bacterium]|nr:response regulator [Verrucomicrobiae bacterium]
MTDPKTKPALRVLYLEDSLADQELVEELLRSEELASEFVMVDDQPGFEKAIEAGSIDLILSDYSLPSFDGLSALAIARERCPELPFILMSGVMGEERAVESLKQGATDYVLKQRIERLVPAIRRAVREVAERERLRLAEEQLRLNEEQLRQITDNVGDLIVQLDLRGDWQYCSPSYRRLHGETAALPSARFFEQVHEADRQAVQDMFAMAIRTGVGQRREFRLVLPSGSIRYLEAQFNVVCDERGSVQSVIAVSRDITDRRHSEEQIRAQAALLDKAQDAITVCDMDDQVVYWNKGAEALYGWTCDEALGRNLHELLHGEISAPIEEARQVVRNRGEWNGELRQKTKGDENSRRQVAVQSRWTLVTDDDGNPKSQLIINTDVTDRNLSESHFLRAQRLESLGALASGIAHDLNNMLAPIVLASQLLRLRVDDSEGQGWLDTLEGSTQRGANLVRQVLTFAKGEEGDRVELSVGHILSEVSAILRQTLDRSIEVKMTKEDKLWPVKGDPTLLHQVVMNLCVNARDVMPQGGRLHISAENVMLRETDREVSRGGRPGVHVLITVADSGPGIPPELQDRIFEPFFTTKERGRGSGLGLTTVQTIVKNHGGFVFVESERNKGCRFKVYLPALTSAPITRPTQSARPTVPRGNGETVLLVDDEAPFREISQATLEKYGYRVLTAADGTEALTVFMRHRNEVSLVMTDIMMPVMDGAELIRSLYKMDLKVRFVAISGLLESEKAVVERVAPGVRVDFLAKPFSTDNLLITVNEALNREDDA